MEEFSYDPRVELDSHANAVVIESNFFVFESTRRTCDVQPLTSDFEIAKTFPMFDRSLAHERPHK